MKFKLALRTNEGKRAKKYKLWGWIKLKRRKIFYTWKWKIKPTQVNASLRKASGQNYHKLQVMNDENLKLSMKKEAVQKWLKKFTSNQNKAICGKKLFGKLQSKPSFERFATSWWGAAWSYTMLHKLPTLDHRVRHCGRARRHRRREAV